MMDKAELDRLAYAGIPLPKELNYRDTLYFLGMRYIYKCIKNPEQGRREKVQLERAVKIYDLDMEAVRRTHDLFSRTESAGDELRKAVTVEERLSAADKLLEAIDGIKVDR